jgi:hypothetical protein
MSNDRQTQGGCGVLQMVSEPTLTVSRARTGQLRRIQWRTGQGRGYVRMGPLGEIQYGTYATNWTHGTHMSVLDVQT